MNWVDDIKQILVCMPNQDATYWCTAVEDGSIGAYVTVVKDFIVPLLGEIHVCDSICVNCNLLSTIPTRSSKRPKHISPVIQNYKMTQFQVQSCLGELEEG